MIVRVLIGLLLMAIGAAPALAEGNLASRATRLDPLVVERDLSFSIKEYQIETGKYYRWQIESKGGDEFIMIAPELFRNAWINQIVINDIEVKPLGGIYGVEFDSEGIADIWFVVIRPGEYSFSAQGHEARGLIGKFVVK